MGISHSNLTDLGNDCTSYDAGDTGTVVRWGDSFEVSMGLTKETSDTERWGVQYKMGKRKSCDFSLSVSHDNNGVKRIFFGLSDSYDNKIDFGVEITRDARGGLRGGITGISSSGRPTSSTTTRAKKTYSIETTILSYGCSQRDGLFVLEMKKKVNSVSTYMVTLAHYYVTKDVGLSAVAKIRSKKGSGFGVEVEGPFKHPSTDLRKVLVQTRRSGAWSPAACPHCDGTKGSTHQSDDPEGQRINHPFFSNRVREEPNLHLYVSNFYNFDESVLNNGGSSRGHGIGSIVRGKFDASMTIHEDQEWRGRK